MVVTRRFFTFKAPLGVAAAATLPAEKPADAPAAEAKVTTIGETAAPSVVSTPTNAAVPLTEKGMESLTAFKALKESQQTFKDQIGAIESAGPYGRGDHPLPEFMKSTDIGDLIRGCYKHYKDSLVTAYQNAVAFYDPVKADDVKEIGARIGIYDDARDLVRSVYGAEGSKLGKYAASLGGTIATQMNGVDSVIRQTYEDLHTTLGLEAEEVVARYPGDDSPLPGYPLAEFAARFSKLTSDTGTFKKSGTDDFGNHFTIPCDSPAERLLYANACTAFEKCFNVWHAVHHDGKTLDHFSEAFVQFMDMIHLETIGTPSDYFVNRAIWREHRAKYDDFQQLHPNYFCGYNHAQQKAYDVRRRSIPLSCLIDNKIRNEWNYRGRNELDIMVPNIPGLDETGCHNYFFSLARELRIALPEKVTGELGNAPNPSYLNWQKGQYSNPAQRQRVEETISGLRTFLGTAAQHGKSIVQVLTAFARAYDSIAGAPKDAPVATPANATPAETAATPAAPRQIEQEIRVNPDISNKGEKTWAERHDDTPEPDASAQAQR